MRKAIIKKENERKSEEEEKNREFMNPVPELEEAIKELRDELSQKNQQIEDFERDSEILKVLYKNGIIDLNGNYIERDNRSVEIFIKLISGVINFSIFKICQKLKIRIRLIPLILC